MANVVGLFEQAAVAADWHSAAEQLDGVVVVDALFDAAHFPIARTVQGMVWKPSGGDGRQLQRVDQGEANAGPRASPTVALTPSTVLASTVEKGCRKANAIQI